MPQVSTQEIAKCVCGSQPKLFWGSVKSPAKVRCLKCRRRSRKFNLSHTCLTDAIADWNKKMSSAAGLRVKEK